MYRNFLLLVCFCTVFSMSYPGNGLAFRGPKIIVARNQILKGFPHRFDIYGSVNAKRAVVFLHGGGGEKTHAAGQLGIIDRDWIIEKNIMYVFPQGQSINDETPTTWNNHVMDSGQDDMAFLRTLAQFIRTTFNINYIVLAGLSNGGMMVNRVWCEEPEMFDTYVSISGPASKYYIAHSEECQPNPARPYMGVFGTDDTVINTKDNWDKPIWMLSHFRSSAVVNPFLISAPNGYQMKRTLRCGENSSEIIDDGNINALFACNDSIALIKVQGGEHDIPSLEEKMGLKIRDLIDEFMELNQY